ncbi:MAG: carbonic anhydrase [Pseudomonadota bacterium]
MILSRRIFLLFLAFCLVLAPVGAFAEEASAKPDPDQIRRILTEGNARFAAGRAENPHTGRDRLVLAGRESQANYALATVLSCSDSRVPVERLFDVGVMDLFVVRVAGAVCNTDEAGSIEYGLAHVNTPLLVVLGHTQCGAVSAVAADVRGESHHLETNIPPLIASIYPAVKRALEQKPGGGEEEMLNLAIEENVKESIRNLFLKSPTARDLVESGKVKVAGAIYDVSTGLVLWLPQDTASRILEEVGRDPGRVVESGK